MFEDAIQFNGQTKQYMILFGRIFYSTDF